MFFLYTVDVKGCGIYSLKTPATEAAINFLNSIFVPPNTNSNVLSNTSSSSSNELCNPFSKLAPVTNTDTDSGEVTRYFLLPRESPNSDPLVYWGNQNKNFPGLSKLAKRYLSIPASSGGVERLFSLTGSIGRRQRSRMKATTMENIVLWKQHRLPMLRAKMKVSRKNQISSAMKEKDAEPEVVALDN